MKGEQKRLNQDRQENDDDDQEMPPKMEQITLQITDTKTRSEKLELKSEESKRKSMIGRNLGLRIDGKIVPPGPGQYNIPSAVWIYNIF